jgi:hypothetical protein
VISSTSEIHLKVLYRLASARISRQREPWL